jgi:hypothetical protein
MKATQLFLVFLLLVETASGQDKFDVFYVAIGSGSYAASHLDRVKGLPEIPGAAKSAKAVANLLSQGGSIFGVTLVSDDTHFVTRADMADALSAVLDDIRTTHPRHPLFVVYFAGHGIADGYSWEHFLLPGNVVYNDELPSIVFHYSPTMLEVTLGAATLVDWLRQANVPFLVLLDTCYEGKQADFIWKPIAPPKTSEGCRNDITGFCQEFMKNMQGAEKFDAQMEEMTASLNEMLANYRRANRFENTYPVLLSAEPGQIASTVADPFNDDPQEDAVAPLARRAMIILGSVIQHHRVLSLRSFLKQMNSQTLDHVTKPAVTYSAVPKEADLLLGGRVLLAGRTEDRLGTGTKSETCCVKPPRIPVPHPPNETLTAQHRTLQTRDYTFVIVDVSDAEHAGTGGTTMHGINNAGLIVGDSTTESFLYKGAGKYVLVDFPFSEALGTSAQGINDAGDIVGYFTTQDAAGSHGYVKKGATFSRIDVPNGTWTEAYGINNRGQIVGEFRAGSSAHSFLLSQGNFTIIDAPVSPSSLLYGYTDTVASGINDAGQIVGYVSYFNQGMAHSGFTYINGTFATLDYPGAKETFAQGMNNHGQIVGYYRTDVSAGFHSVPAHGFVYSDHNFVPFDVPGAKETWALGVNDAGQISGWFSDGAWHGFVATRKP